MGKGSAPAAPDPYATAAAQTSSNQQTAAYNSAANKNNVYTPLGNSTWQQNGTDPATGAQLYNNTISLTPTGQQTLDAQQQQQLGMANAGNQFLGNVTDQISKPIDYSGIGSIQNSVNGGNLDQARQQAQSAIYDRQTSMLDPQYAQNKESLDAQLANQGLTIGSQAYNNAQNNFARQKDFAYGQARDSAITGGNDYANQQFNQGLNSANLNNSSVSQGLSQLLAQRNQPLNELSAFQSGSQVQQPSFQSTPAVNAAGTDVAGAINNAYQGGLNSYNAQVGQGNSTMGAVGSLASLAAMYF